MSALAVLIPLVPALVALTSVVLFVRGWQLLRSDAIEGLEVHDLVLLRTEQRDEAVGRGPLDRLAALLVPSLRRLVGAGGIRWIQRQVDLAGRPDGATVDTVLRRVGRWVVLLSPAFVLFLVNGNVIGLVLCPVVVVVLPAAGLSRARRLRQERLDHDLPDFLDILSITVSAGVGFRPALARVAERYGGPLGEEMALTLNQITNGASRRQAFADLRRRNDSEALASFVTAFLQSEELGAPLVQTLNQIAVDMRRDGAQRMRRQAARVAPRVTLVTSLVLVPGALILVIVGLMLGSGVDFSALLGGFE
jgi:tight adherence protein C